MSVNYIGVLSSAYSGSTLLTALLGNQANFISVGELNSFYGKVIQRRGRLDCSCGENFWDCPIWGPISNEFKSKTFPENWSQLRLSPSIFNRVFHSQKIPMAAHAYIQKLLLGFQPKASQKMAANNRGLMESIRNHSGQNIIVDSSKNIQAFIYKSNLQNTHPAAILLIKDPKEVLASHKKRQEQTDIKGLCTSIFRKHQYNQKLLRRFNIPYAVARYEDICQTPLETVGQALKSLNIPPGDLNVEKFNVNNHILFGNQSIRYAESDKIESKITWPQILSKEDLAIYHHCYKKFLHHLQYPA